MAHPEALTDTPGTARTWSTSSPKPHHPKGLTQPRKHPCRICGQQDIPVNNKGGLKLHQAEGRNGLVQCPGSYQIIAPGRLNRGKKGIDPVARALPASPYAATTGRLNDNAKSSPKGVGKIIGGGSPGLGKNAK